MLTVMAGRGKAREGRLKGSGARLSGPVSVAGLRSPTMGVIVSEVVATEYTRNPPKTE
jgi:hypothetical protein